MSILFISSVVGFCLRDWVVQNFLTFKTNKRIHEAIDKRIFETNNIELLKVNTKNSLPITPIESVSTLDISEPEEVNFEVMVDANICNTCGLTDAFECIQRHLYANVYMIEFINSNNIVAAAIIYDTFGEILSSKFDEQQFPDMSYDKFGKIIIYIIAMIIIKDKSLKAIIYIVSNELNSGRDPLRKSFINKYNKRYNNIRRTIQRIKELVRDIYKNNLKQMKKIIDEQYTNVTLFTSYDVNNVLTQFMMPYGKIKYISTLPFIVSTIEITENITEFINDCNLHSYTL